MKYQVTFNCLVDMIFEVEAESSEQAMDEAQDAYCTREPDGWLVHYREAYGPELIVED